MQNLKNEIPEDQIKAVWDAIRLEREFFKEFNAEDTKAVSQFFRTFKMFRGDVLAKTTEKLSWVGVILMGEAGVFKGLTKLSVLGIGDMIGYMSVIPDLSHHKFDIIALQPGYISIIHIKDLLKLATTSPALFYKFNASMVLKTLQTLSLQYLNAPFLPSNAVTWNDNTSKKIQDLINTCPEISGLIPAYFDTKEQKVFQTACRAVKLQPGQVLIKQNHPDQCIFVVTTGELLENNTNYIKEKSIIGFEQFFFGKRWESEIISKSTSEIIIIHREIFNSIAQRSPGSGIKIYKLLNMLYLNFMTYKANRRLPQSFIELDFRKLEVPDDGSFIFKRNYKESPVDYVYITDSLLPKRKENFCAFLESKKQKQILNLNPRANFEDKVNSNPKKQDTGPEYKTKPMPDSSLNKSKLNLAHNPNIKSKPDLDSNPNDKSKTHTNPNPTATASSNPNKKSNPPTPNLDKKKSSTKPLKKPASEKDDIFQTALKKTETGYIEIEEEIDDLIESIENQYKLKKNLLNHLESLKKKNADLKKILYDKEIDNNILSVK
jgi:hypothetical protein